MRKCGKEYCFKSVYTSTRAFSLHVTVLGLFLDKLSSVIAFQAHSQRHKLKIIYCIPCLEDICCCVFYLPVKSTSEIRQTLASIEEKLQILSTAVTLHIRKIHHNVQNKIEIRKGKERAKVSGIMEKSKITL